MNDCGWCHVSYIHYEAVAPVLPGLGNAVSVWFSPVLDVMFNVGIFLNEAAGVSVFSVTVKLSEDNVQSTVSCFKREFKPIFFKYILFRHISWQNLHSYRLRTSETFIWLSLQTQMSRYCKIFSIHDMPQNSFTTIS